MLSKAETIDLFESRSAAAPRAFQPLADRIRPTTLADFSGQEHLVGVGKVLRQAIEADQLMSLIFWGPPAVGKTTLARIIAQETASEFHALSAVTAGVADIKQTIEIARKNQKYHQKRTILFIDEIHRFNKAQQDALLHSVEDGTLILIGATTENPSFEVNSALLSRCQVFQLFALTPEQIRPIIQRALQQDDILRSQKIQLPDATLELLLLAASGDVRVALNGLELASRICQPDANGEKWISPELIQNTLQKSYTLYDKKGDLHYDTISAFIKSVRGSDPDAAIYYLARMLEAGEEPLFIARRLIILAAEDIGNANPMALVLATSAFTAVSYVGLPEAQLVLAQATTYLASAEKSNASYLAINQARSEVRQGTLAPIPMYLRNAPTQLMQQLGYAEGYKYPHDYPNHFVVENYLPTSLTQKIYYQPTENGQEKKLKERLLQLWPKRRKAS
ncbi:replication-associated recombination protein A [candidate division KSB1 bacterium]|nr:replication-associated recombination protein A [candidate division KSB1 bacterium]